MTGTVAATTSSRWLPVLERLMGGRCEARSPCTWVPYVPETGENASPEKADTVVNVGTALEAKPEARETDKPAKRKKDEHAKPTVKQPSAPPEKPAPGNIVEESQSSSS